MTVVDVHCHTFNADDLPVRGFVQRVAFDDKRLGTYVAALVDVLIQGAAPGFVVEQRQLDLLLSSAGSGGDLELPGAAAGAVVPIRDLDAEVEAAVAMLQVSEPELLASVEFEMRTDDEFGGDVVEEEGLGDAWSAAKRAVKWAKLFGMSRLEVTSRLVANFGDKVDLFTPLLVDLGMGLHDAEGTTMRQQIVLHEKISRLSMLGLLPGSDRARVHPFIGFDPRRQLQAQHEVETPLDLCRTAVEKYGFVGVKLYPPMGFRPIGNTADTGGRPGRFDPAAVDGVLRELYEWCEKEQVPVTAHCNPSNEAHEVYKFFSAPESWARVLEEFPGLHLNLGHFGGANLDEKPDGWPWQIARLATEERPFLFADVGNHKIHRADIAEAYLKTLKAMFSEPATAGMQQRLMYGSDWYMLAGMPRHEQFLADYERLYREQFPDDAAVAGFRGANALRFLGFDDAENNNAKRLRRRYEKYAPDRIPAWLA